MAGIKVVDPPDDLNDPSTSLNVAEVVRIAGGCALVDYVALDGRSVAAIRRLLDGRPDVFAVGEPIRGIEPLHTSGAHKDYGPNSGDHYDDGAGAQWHLPQNYMEDLWDGWGLSEPHSCCRRRQRCRLQASGPARAGRRGRPGGLPRQRLLGH